MVTQILVLIPAVQPNREKKYVRCALYSERVSECAHRGQKEAGSVDCACVTTHGGSEDEKMKFFLLA